MYSPDSDYPLYTISFPSHHEIHFPRLNIPFPLNCISDSAFQPNLTPSGLFPTSNFPSQLKLPSRTGVVILRPSGLPNPPSRDGSNYQPSPSTRASAPRLAVVSHAFLDLLDPFRHQRKVHLPERHLAGTHHSIEPRLALLPRLHLLLG